MTRWHTVWIGSRRPPCGRRSGIDVERRQVSTPGGGEADPSVERLKAQPAAWNRLGVGSGPVQLSRTAGDIGGGPVRGTQRDRALLEVRLGRLRVRGGQRESVRRRVVDREQTSPGGTWASGATPTVTAERRDSITVSPRSNARRLSAIVSGCIRAAVALPSSSASGRVRTPVLYASGRRPVVSVRGYASSIGSGTPR